MKITTVDGRLIEVVGSPQLKAELDRYRAAMHALVPDLDGDDDTAGERALQRHAELAAGFNSIVDNLETWNKVVAEENRRNRKALAVRIREERNHG